MMNNKSILNRGLCFFITNFVCLLILLLNTQCKKEDSLNTQRFDIIPKPSVKSQSQVDDFLSRWDTISYSFKGGELSAERSKLLGEVISVLGKGAGLCEFIMGIHDRREFRLADSLLLEHKSEIFSGDYGVATREFLRTREQSDFIKTLYFYAGYYFSGAGVKEYIESITQPSSQERFLTGYCSRLAEHDQQRAVEEYKALRSDKISFYGLLDVMDYLSPDGDFANTDAIFPDDFDEKNSMGAALRYRLLKRWALFHPEAAANYVSETPLRVKPDSIRAVIDQWARSKPEYAIAWVEKRPAGPLQDAALEELSRFALKSAKPQDAWKFAAKVTNFDTKVYLATEVFKEWAKVDKVAAEAAWVEVFPQ
jgi:hypothetical protein